jgi:opacity protein-like surface antigen
MKSFLLGTAALTTLCLSLPALAADLPARVTKAPPVLVSPAYDWSGFYVGVSAGYTFGEDDDISTTGQVAANIANVAGGARPGQVRLERDGLHRRRPGRLQLATHAELGGGSGNRHLLRRYPRG